MSIAAAFAFSAAAGNGNDEWERMVRLNSVSERNGIYKMPAPGGTATAYISEITVKRGRKAAMSVYSANEQPSREFLIVSKESPAVKPGDKVILDFAFSGETSGVSVFAYADMDMDGLFEKCLVSGKGLGKKMSVSVKIPEECRQGKIRIRVRYTSDAGAGGADDPVNNGKCYDIVLFVVDD